MSRIINYGFYNQNVRIKPLLKINSETLKNLLLNTAFLRIKKLDDE